MQTELGFGLHLFVDREAGIARASIEVPTHGIYEIGPIALQGLAGAGAAERLGRDPAASGRGTEGGPAPGRASPVGAAPRRSSGSP